jgi:glycosyltransferase involved in cell wall biosynthesis
VVGNESRIWRSGCQDGAGRPLTRHSSVLAVVPHYRCERWLPDCLDSLLRQTRPPEGIVVVDDGSGEPPVELVAQFPQVTLLASAENVGPYRLIQQVIDESGYDAYLFQDADDWSTEDRLETLLDEAERSGAEYVGCQGFRILTDEHEAVPYFFPLDPNATLAMHPAANPVHHPASIVSRDLVKRIGGFATGLRFSGDSEFLRRAAHVARIVNSPRYCYYYRMRANSLTSDSETGIGSPARQQVWDTLIERAIENARRVAEGQPPMLEPIAVAPPIALRHLSGPAWPSVGRDEPCRPRGGEASAR